MEKRIKIEGMSCYHCVMSVQKNLSKLKLNKFKVDVGFADIEFDETKVKEIEIIKIIEEAGFKVVQ